MRVTPLNKFSFKVFPPQQNMIEISLEDSNGIKAGTHCFNSDLTAVIPYVPTAEEIEAKYKRSVISEIRKHYTVDDELAIHRQREEKPLEYQSYFDYCEQCKNEARGGIPM